MYVYIIKLSLSASLLLCHGLVEHQSCGIVLGMLCAGHVDLKHRYSIAQCKHVGACRQLPGQVYDMFEISVFSRCIGVF